MEIRNLKEISKMDSPALSSLLDYWKDYDTNSILLAYAELKRRKYTIPTSLQKKQNQFCEKNNIQNIEELLNTTMKEMGFNSYEEYYYNEFPEKALTEEQKKEIAENKNVEKILKINSSAINPNNILSAGKAIKSVVYVTLIMILSAVFAFMIVSSSKDIDTIKNTYVFMGILSLICNIIILIQLFTAGDNLVKSVE